MVSFLDVGPFFGLDLSDSMEKSNDVFTLFLQFSSRTFLLGKKLDWFSQNFWSIEICRNFVRGNNLFSCRGAEPSLALVFPPMFPSLSNLILVDLNDCSVAIFCITFFFFWNPLFIVICREILGILFTKRKLHTIRINRIFSSKREYFGSDSKPTMKYRCNVITRKNH